MKTADHAEDWQRLLDEATAAGERFEQAVRAEAGAFLETGQPLPPPPGEPDEDVAWLAGAVPGVTVLREIGRGGMGVVYEAVEHATARRVAVKLLHHDRRTPGLVRRLQREAQALARLNHPGIARLHTAGLCAPPLAGSPYVVLELVEGEDPLQYADSRRLTIRQRAELLARIADAIGAAHRGGVLHLDIKPGNVLVAEDGAVRVLDFSTAHILDQAAGAPTLTFLTHPFGSLPAMAPEQVQGRAGLPATDVYALGTLLYRLITGAQPLDLDGIPLSEATRRIAEDEPPPPRARNRAVPRDLDLITRVAMAKDPADRYPDAASLAADLERFLRAEPIAGRRPGPLRRARAFAARHRPVVIGAGAVIGALTLGGAVAANQAFRATRAEATAVERFEDIRELAGSVIFDVHDAIEHLPGSTIARQMLLERAKEYLDRLYDTPAADDALRFERALAEIRLARVEGWQGSANLGDIRSTRERLDRALKALTELHERNPEAPEIRLALAKAISDRTGAGPAIPLGAPVESRPLRQRRLQALRLAESVVDADPENTEAQWLVREFLVSYAGMLLRDDRGPEAIAATDKSVRVAESLLASHPDDAAAHRHAAISHYYAAYMRREFDTPGAVQHGERAAELLRAAIEMQPWNATFRAELTRVLGDLARHYANERRFPESHRAADEAIETISLITGLDPANQRWHRQWTVAHAWSAEAFGLHAADTAVDLPRRLESAVRAVDLWTTAHEGTLERQRRGWLYEWESHYPELARTRLENARAALAELESEHRTALDDAR